MVEFDKHEREEILALLRFIKTYTDKGAGLDYGGAKANFRKRRLVKNMFNGEMLLSSGNPPERCIIGLTEKGLTYLTSSIERRKLRTDVAIQISVHRSRFGSL